MSHVVVVGAGIGGVPAALETRQALGGQHRITLINERPSFDFTPSNIWVQVGTRRREQISVALAPIMARHRIDFIPQAMTRLEPEKNQLHLTDGQVIDYDFLILATGPKLAFQEISGLGPDHHTHSVCTLDHAEKARDAFLAFMDNPGPIVVGAAQGVSCFGPAYEVALLLDRALRRRRIRHKVPMTFITSEPYIGHLGLGGVANAKDILERELRKHDITFLTNTSIRNIERQQAYITVHNDRGEPQQEKTLPFSYAMILPPFTGIDPLCGIEGLVNPRGFVLIDQHQANPAFANIYAVGVCVAIAPPEPTPLPTGIPKTGYMIESMVKASVANIAATIAGKPPTATATWNAICLADLGDQAVAFVAMPQIPPRNVAWAKKGRWVHWSKVAFERYFLRKVRTGSTDPAFERLALRLVGIEKLERLVSRARQ